MAAGRTSGALADVPERITLARNGRSIDLATSIDHPALAAWVAARAEALRVGSVSAKIVPTVDSWVATMARDGAYLDQAAALSAIEAALVSGSADTARVELPMTTVRPRVDRLDTVLAIAAAKRVAVPLTVNFRDDASWTIPAASIHAAIHFEDRGDRLVPVVDTTFLDGTLTTISKRIARPANETLILKTKSGKTFGFVPGKNGRNVDTAATAGRIAELLEARAAGTVTAAAPSPVVLSVIPPELSAEEAALKTHQVTLVGAWTTKFFSSERNGFGNNIRIPARLINGTVVGPGEVFDFWRVVGPVTFERGFRMGGFIEGGQTNPTGAIGGGICSTSTTLFNAALRAGYEIVERKQHAYYINRYPLGLDATVSKIRGRISQNMRFRNDTPNALYIRGLSGSGFVRFEIYSLPVGRTVSFTSPEVTNIRRAIDQTFRRPDMPAGTSERAETPTDGKDVVVFRTVRDAAGKIVHVDRFVSHYVKVDGILYLGTG
jgi:vancomycin resistance protein YoaR